MDSADSVAHPTVKRAIEHDRCTVLRPIAANRPFPLADAEVGIKQADIWHDCYISLALAAYWWTTVGRNKPTGQMRATSERALAVVTATVFLPLHQGGNIAQRRT